MAERPKLDDVTPDGKPRFATWAEYEVAKDEWLRTETIRELESRQAAKPKPVWDSGAFAGLVILALIGYGCWTGGSWVWHKVEKEQTTSAATPNTRDQQIQQLQARIAELGYCYSFAPRRASESHHAHAYAPLHSPHKRTLKED